MLIQQGLYDGFPYKRDFYKVTNIEDEMMKLGYDCIEIKGREYVNFKSTDVLYFKTEEQLKNYFYSNI